MQFKRTTAICLIFVQAFICGKISAECLFFRVVSPWTPPGANETVYGPWLTNYETTGISREFEIKLYSEFSKLWLTFSAPREPSWLTNYPWVKNGVSYNEQTNLLNKFYYEVPHPLGGTSINNTFHHKESRHENGCCPKGTKWVTAANNGQGACWPIRDIFSQTQGSCPALQPKQGNPIYPLLGTKQEELNTGLQLGGQTLSLIYDTALGPYFYGNPTPPSLPNPGEYISAPAKALSPGNLGDLWTTTLHRRLIIRPGGQSVIAVRGGGLAITFYLMDGTWRSSTTPQSKLISNGNSYILIDKHGLKIERYNSGGLLISSHSASGMALMASHTENNSVGNVAIGQMKRLTDPFGRGISFQYGVSLDGQIVLDSITDPAGQNILASYDSQSNLTGLTWQDQTERSFVYDSPNPGQQWALTGVVDENNKRYSTFTYYPEGVARSTEHAGGSNKFVASYGTMPRPVLREEVDLVAGVVLRYHEWQLPMGAVISQPRGGNIEFGATAVLGASGQSAQGSPRSAGVSQPAGAGCGASSSHVAYDSATGNVLSQDDFNSKRICYTQDSLNRETSRIEGLLGGNPGTVCSTALNTSSFTSLPAEARKISTQWHPDWKLETRRAEPGKITWWIYNGQPDPFNGDAAASCTTPMYGATSVDPLPDGQPIAVLCKQVVQSTTDATGSLGFASPLQAPDPTTPWQMVSRIVSYTYNQYGQMLTSTDERGQVTTYVYYTTTGTYTKGDLWKVTNALGHVTEYTQYNPHGQVLQAKDPNGVITSYTYDLRQRLTSVTQAGQLTQIDWWPTGLLKKVTQPDGSWMSYTYDDAHRLTGIADSLGNSVAYELDNAGNRKQERVKDSSGALTLQIDRNYDALNRLWKTSTGVPM